MRVERKQSLKTRGNNYGISVKYEKQQRNESKEKKRNKERKREKETEKTTR